MSCSSGEQLLSYVEIISNSVLQFHRSYSLLLTELYKYSLPPVKSPVILSSKGKYLDSESSIGSGKSDSIRSIVPSGEITKEECIAIYKLVRRSVIDEALYNLGVEKWTQSNMQKMECTVLEAKIKRWLYAVRAAMKTVFQGERALCDAIFSSSDKISESCFAEICRDATLNLFSFAENFRRSKRILSPEKMFRALDMYEADAELSPEIQSIFSHEFLSQVRTVAVAAMVKLGEAVRVMLTQFEAAIKKDASKSSAAGGIHPLTKLEFFHSIGVPLRVSCELGN